MHDSDVQEMLFVPPRPAKRCPKCFQEKAASEFPRRRSNIYSPGSYCLECQRVYSRAHYRSNKEKHNARRRVHQREYALRNRQLISRWFVGKSCVDCGNHNPLVLEFDHVRGKKAYDISTMLRAGFAWERVLEEIAKCEIRCANCHRIKTAAQFGWKGKANGQP